MTPVDLNLYKTVNLQESYMRYGQEIKNNRRTKEKTQEQQ